MSFGSTVCGKCFYDAINCKCRLLNSWCEICAECGHVVQGEGKEGAMMNLELHIIEAHPPHIDQLDFIDEIREQTMIELMEACLPEEYDAAERHRDHKLKGWE